MISFLVSSLFYGAFAEFDGVPEAFVIDVISSGVCLDQSFDDRLAAVIERRTGIPSMIRIEDGHLASYPNEFIQITIVVTDDNRNCAASVALQDGYIRSEDRMPVFDGQYYFPTVFSALQEAELIETITARATERANWIAVGTQGRN